MYDMLYDIKLNAKIGFVWTVSSWEYIEYIMIPRILLDNIEI